MSQPQPRLRREQLDRARQELDAQGETVCAWPGCQVTSGLHVDHIVSLANGGGNDVANLQYLCAQHNQAKGAGATIAGTNDANAEHRSRVKLQGQRLYSDTMNALKRHIYHDDERTFIVLTLAIMAAQAGLRESQNFAPIIVANSAAPGCGKSVLADLAHYLTPGSHRTEYLSNVTALMRLNPSCIVLDEAQNMGLHKGDQRGYLNARHRANGTFTVNTPSANEGDWEAREYPVFGPTFLAGLRLALADDTRSRAIEIQLQPAPAGQTPAKVTRQVVPGLQQLGQRLAAWSNDAGPLLRPSITTDITSGRRADVWEPLLQVANLLGLATWAIALTTMHDHEVQQAEARIPGQLETLVADLESLLANPTTEAHVRKGLIPSDTLTRLLESGYPDAWGSTASQRINATQLARLLRDIGITPTRRRDGDSNRRGYDVKALQAAIDKHTESQDSGKTQDVLLFTRAISEAVQRQQVQEVVLPPQ